MVNVSYRSYSGDQIQETLSYSAVKQMVQAICSPRYTHSRTRHWCRQDVTAIYHRDANSPSGVLLAGGGPDVLVNAILKRHRETSPLSPTEGFR